MPIRTIIVDDEANNIETLSLLLQDMPVVEVVGRAASADEARALIARESPQLVFLDINMPGEDGFQLLASLPERNFALIFVSAYSDYGIRALKVSAADYLLKPVSFDELLSAVQKVAETMEDSDQPAVQRERSIVDNLVRNASLPPTSIRIAVPHLGGISFVNIEDISYLQADSNYTILHRVNMQKLVVSRTLREFEDLLSDKGFMRVHKSNMVNLRYVREYSTTEGGVLRMSDGCEVAISRRMQEEFLRRMGAYSLGFKK